jgi:hypothetical protein
VIASRTPWTPSMRLIEYSLDRVELELLGKRCKRHNPSLASSQVLALSAGKEDSMASSSEGSTSRLRSPHRQSRFKAVPQADIDLRGIDHSGNDEQLQAAIQT